MEIVSSSYDRPCRNEKNDLNHVAYPLEQFRVASSRLQFFSIFGYFWSVTLNQFIHQTLFS